MIIKSRICTLYDLCGPKKKLKPNKNKQTNKKQKHKDISFPARHNKGRNFNRLIGY